MYVQYGFHCPPTYKQTTYKKQIAIYRKTYTFPFQLSGKAPKKERREIKQKENRFWADCIVLY